MVYLPQQKNHETGENEQHTSTQVVRHEITW